jgi:hypothetical protein
MEYNIEEDFGYAPGRIIVYVKNVPLFYILDTKEIDHDIKVVLASMFPDRIKSARRVRLLFSVTINGQSKRVDVEKISVPTGEFVL